MEGAEAMMRIGDLRDQPTSTGARPPPPREPEPLEEITEGTRRRLFESAARLGTLGAERELRNLLSDVGLKILQRRITVAEIVARIDAALSRAETAMAEARAHVRRLADVMEREQ
jgi:hypothetical protein